MSNLHFASALLAGVALMSWVGNGLAAPKPKPVIKAKPKPQSSKPPMNKLPVGRTYAKIEAAFQWPGFSGDPFDYEANDVRVQMRLPNRQIVSLPAFFDGGTTWRVRHTPSAPGSYEVVSISNNGAGLPVKAQPARWTVAGASGGGFVRIDPKNRRRFTLENGARYYPLGTNQAWKSSDYPDIPVMFGKMKDSGQNWSRVWMNHWDGKNLDWPKVGKLGQLSIEVAQRLDSIVESADANGIYFQLVLQHHGQYTKAVNPNWDDNPYNVKVGGFLNEPDEFFTNEQARKLTKRKLRYTVARYGYSPHIMAWELWNEVQFSDAGREKKWDIVAAWHTEMAAFLRSQDFYRHLITTSSDLPPAVFASSDYYQRHTYPSNLIATLKAPAFEGAEWAPKPAFVGEYGSDRTPEWTMHSGLWASLMSPEAGAGQYWYWDRTDKNNYYPHFAAASGFVKASGFAAQDSKSELKTVPLKVTTPERGSLLLSPSGGWSNTRKSDFDLSNPADIEAFEKLPSFFQGQNHRDMNPAPLTIRVDSPGSGSLRIRLGQVAKAGANIKVTVGTAVTEFPFPATENDSSEERVLSVPIADGRQTISLENTGQDWVVWRDLSIPGAAMQIDGVAKANRDFALAWFYNRENVEEEAPTTKSSGSATLASVAPGNYRVTWWDTVAGQPLKTEMARADGQGLKLAIPDIARDVAVWAVKSP